jgi:hypothetical protein
MTHASVKRGCYLSMSGGHRGSFRARIGPRRPSTKGTAIPGTTKPKTLVPAEGPREARVVVRPSHTMKGDRPGGRRQQQTTAAAQPPLRKPMTNDSRRTAAASKGIEHRHTTLRKSPHRETSRLRKGAHRGTSTRRGVGRDPAVQRIVGKGEALRNQAPDTTQYGSESRVRRDHRCCDSNDGERRRKGQYGRSTRVGSTSGEGGGGRAACNASPPLPSRTMPRPRGLESSVEAQGALPHRTDRLRDGDEHIRCKAGETHDPARPIMRDMTAHD